VVPYNSPLDADLPEQELAAQSIIEQAKVQGGRRVSGHFEKVRAGQSGRLIVEEARSMQARAIVMALRPRSGAGGSVFGRSVETVLAERPCRVIIQSDPTAVRTPV
jgi:APA family basic amino acid/polyamine antiporter